MQLPAASTGGNVSSFGYGGTIAHTVLAAGSGGGGGIGANASADVTALRSDGADPAGKGLLASRSQLTVRACVLKHPESPLLAYHRRAFAWRDTTASMGSGRTRMHSVCWAKAPHDSDTATRRRLLLTARSLHHPDGAREAAHSWHQAVSLLLQADATAAPSLHGVQLALALAQQLAGRARPACVLVLTCEAVTSGGAPSDAAHGDAWGFARVLRLENVALRTQSTDIARHSESAVALLALTATTSETEKSWRAARRFAARRGSIHKQRRVTCFRARLDHYLLQGVPLPPPPLPLPPPPLPLNLVNRTPALQPARVPLRLL